jgi:hypothetical protein
LHKLAAVGRESFYFSIVMLNSLQHNELPLVILNLVEDDDFI